MFFVLLRYIEGKKACQDGCRWFVEISRGTDGTRRAAEPKCVVPPLRRVGKNNLTAILNYGKRKKNYEKGLLFFLIVQYTSKEWRYSGVRI